MRIHDSQDHAVDKYGVLDREVALLQISKVLPVECEDVKEVKQVWDHLRYTFPDLVLTRHDNYVYV